MKKIQSISNIKRFHAVKEPTIFYAFSKFDPRAFECARKFMAVEDTRLKSVHESSHYVCGVVGAGKTVMALNLVHDIARQRYAKGCTRIAVTTVKYYSLLHDIKCTFDKQNTTTTDEVIKKYQSTDILLIDDIGMSPLTDWGYTQLYMILDYRYSNKLITIFTSNLTIAQLATVFADDRIPSRIQHDCGENIYELTNKSYR